MRSELYESPVPVALNLLSRIEPCGAGLGAHLFLWISVDL